MVNKYFPTFGKAWNAVIKPLELRRERRCKALLSLTPPQSVGNRPRRERQAVTRAILFLGKRHPAFVKNWYEGGFPFGDGTRSYVPGLVQDARYDQTFITRREALRRMRYWNQNSPIQKRSVDVSRQYVIGTHMPVVTSLATSEDPDADGKTWTERAEIVWSEMITHAGMDGESLFQMLTVGHDCKKVDGDLLFVETSRRARVKPYLNSDTTIEKTVPALMMVEGHRIETPFQKYDSEGIDIVDGVQFRNVETRMPDGKIRKLTQRTGFWIKDNSQNFAVNENSWAFVAAENCEFIFTPHRVNQIRGLSDYIVAEPTLAMLEDLLKLEMRAQEVQSAIATFITNGSGALVDDRVKASLGAMNIKVSTDGNGKAIATADDITKATEMYSKIWGGENRVARTGDTMTHMAPTRPAAATLNLWQFLIDSYCVAAKVPRILVFPKTLAGKGQGTEVRAELEAANAAFIAEFNLNWKPLIHRAWKYFIGWAIKNDPRLVDPPSNWEHIEVSPPRSVTVDAGYDSASDLAELAAGVGNLHTWAQKLGTTKARLIEQSVDDVFAIKLKCAKKAQMGEYKTFGITVEAAEVRQDLSAVIKNLAAMKTAEAQTTVAENAEITA